MIRVMRFCDLAKFLFIVCIVAIVIGVFQIGTWTRCERDASARYIGPPLSVRFVGTLHPPDYEGKRVSRTLKLSWDGQNWKLDVDNLVVLTSSVTQMQIFQALRPYYLRLTGPKEVLGILKGSELLGKPLTISGYLYINHRRLMVSEINTVFEEGK